MSISKYRSRTHMLLLYPEDLTHLNAIEKIKQSYDYALILHDKDIFTVEDETKNQEHKAGTYKKAHYHIIIRFNQAKWNTAISNELGIDLNYIEEVKNFNNALMYLIHYNDTDKTQYEINEVQGNLRNRLIETINKNEKNEGEKVADLIQFIKNHDSIITVTDFAEYCALNGYWAEFRRSGAIFCKIIEEHNNKYQSAKCTH